MSVPYLVAQNTYKPVSTTPSYAAISGLSEKGRQAISAAQVAHPEYYHSKVSDALGSLQSKISDTFEDSIQPSSPPKVYIPNSAQSVSSVNVPQIEFINADLAKHYGMSKSTAYQEALSNTSYQRAVRDMKSAGLNPAVLFGAGRAIPASASVYASDVSSGIGYSRSSGSSRSGSGNGKLFSGSAYSAIQAIGGLVGLVTTKRPDGFWIGSQTAKGAMGLLDSLVKK